MKLVCTSTSQKDFSRPFSVVNPVYFIDFSWGKIIWSLREALMCQLVFLVFNLLVKFYIWPYIIRPPFLQSQSNLSYMLVVNSYIAAWIMGTHVHNLEIWYDALITALEKWILGEFWLYLNNVYTAYFLLNWHSANIRTRVKRKPI